MKHFFASIAALALCVSACGETVTTAPPGSDAGNDLGPVDVPVAAPDARDATPPPDAPLPPDDADPTCPNNGVERCLNHPPGPCEDLADGMGRTVRFAGFRHDHTVSCAGRMTGMGPDAVLPLTIRRTSDVNITVVPATGDTVVVALTPASRCGDPRAELQCINGSSAIGGIAVARASSVPPGDYEVIVGSVNGSPTQVTAAVTPSLPRAPGDLCPGVTVTPDGAPATMDTRSFFTTPDHGTTCGYYSSSGLGWVDGVFTFTTTAQRDVTVTVTGDGDEPVNVELSSVCGSRAFLIPGCDSGNPARRVVHNLPAGTWYAVVDYLPMHRPDHVLTATVTTAPPTPPGPASHCPGVPLAQGATASLEADTLVAGPELACLSNQRVSGFLSFAAPTEPGDVLVNVATSDFRSNAGLALRAPCDGDMTGACVGPLDRAASSVWARYRSLTPGQTYFIQAATTASGGQLSARWVRVPAATPTPVTGNVTCDTAAQIPPEGGIFTGTTDGSTAVLNPMCATAMTGCVGARGVLYRLDLTERRRVVIRHDAMGFDALLAVNQGDMCPGRSIRDQLACNDDWYSTDSQLDLTLNAGRYWVFAGGCGATQSGPYELDVAIFAP
jgi:hypothetical protein